MSPNPSATPAQVLQARLHLRRDAFLLDVELEVPNRGVTALFGPSGCGKTSVLRALAGLEPTLAGRIAWVATGRSGTAQPPEVWWHVDRDASTKVRVPAHHRAIGMVFQDARLFGHLSVRANIDYGHRRVPRDQRRIDLDELIALLDLEPLLERRPAQISGGEAQRVAVARALACSPRLLLLDEPLSALDEARKAEVLPYLERLKSHLALPMVYVSHDWREVARMADQLVLMAGGQVQQHGPLQEVTASTRGAFALREDAGVVMHAQLLQWHETWDCAELRLLPAGNDQSEDLSPMSRHDAGVPDDLRAWSTDPRLRSHSVGHVVRVLVQARDVSLSLAPHANSSIANQWPAHILARQDDERGRCLFELALGSSNPGDTSGPRARLLARTTRRSAELLDLRVGRAVTAQVKAVAVVE